jgi:hypothetical protein
MMVLARRAAKGKENPAAFGREAAASRKHERRKHEQGKFAFHCLVFRAFVFRAFVML